LSRLYQYSPFKFKGFLNELLDDPSLIAGVQFYQQQKSKSSIPDGTISQESFKIVIETKRDKSFNINQLIEHLKTFSEEKYQILLLLSPQKLDAISINNVEESIKKFNNEQSKSVKFISTTFQDIITKYRDILNDYEYELIEIIEDYQDYCIDSKLIIDDSLMRVVTCGWTLKDNFNFDLYYDPAHRGYSSHNYIGIYSDKSVRGIGKIENIITADLLPDNSINIKDRMNGITGKQKTNIIGAIQAAKNINWDISIGNKFFCVKKFFETDFRKETKFPLQGSKFFNLKNLLNVKILPSTQEIATLLSNKTW